MKLTSRQQEIDEAVERVRELENVNEMQRILILSLRDEVGAHLQLVRTCVLSLAFVVIVVVGYLVTNTVVCVCFSVPQCRVLLLCCY